MTVELIRKHRKEIMAIAMLWIAIRHSNFSFGNKAIRFVLYGSGYGGVDIFLLLSGFGIYYACKKSTSYWSFIKRRFLRVFPYNIPICIILYFLGRKTFCEMLVDGSALSIWFRNDWIAWYTSFLIFLYLLTPLYYKLFKKNPALITFFGVTLTCVLCYFMPSYQYVYVFFRTNVYLIGFYFAYLDDNDNRTNMWWLVIIMIFGWYLLYYFFHHYGNDIPHVLPFLFITPGLTMLIAWFLDKVTIFNKILNFIGDYTYQFYLIHEELLIVLYNHYEQLYRPGIHFDFLINFIGIVLAFLLAIIYKKAVDKIMNVIMKKQEKV